MESRPLLFLLARGTGTALRESPSARCSIALLKPLGALVVEELRAKLHPDAALSFETLRAGDITGSARAFGSLVTAGLTPSSAASIVGLDDVEVQEVRP